MNEKLAMGLFTLVLLIGGVIALGTLAVWLAPFIAIALALYVAEILLSDKKKD